MYKRKLSMKTILCIVLYIDVIGLNLWFFSSFFFKHVIIYAKPYVWISFWQFPSFCMYFAKLIIFTSFIYNTILRMFNGGVKNVILCCSVQQKQKNGVRLDPIQSVHIWRSSQKFCLLSELSLNNIAFICIIRSWLYMVVINACSFTSKIFSK